MAKTRKVCRMTLTSSDRGWKGEHPLGSMVSFYKYDETKENKTTQKWGWAYENADAVGFKTLTDAVEDWRSTVGLPV